MEYEQDSDRSEAQTNPMLEFHGRFTLFPVSLHYSAFEQTQWTGPPKTREHP